MKKNNVGVIVPALIKLFYFLLPVMLVVFGAYFFYFKFFIHRHIVKTRDDIQIISKNIDSFFAGKQIKNFETSVLYYNNLLPFDIEAKNIDSKISVKNRFGGEMEFFESVATLKEQTLYFALFKDQEKYRRVYPGVSSYIIFFSGLKKRDCRSLSMTDWKRFMPSFLGMEIGIRTPQHPKDGYFNLQNFILIENVHQKYKSVDNGITSRKPLSKQQAKSACSCHDKTCTFAIKFLHGKP